MGARGCDVLPAPSQGSLCSVAPWERSFSAARETIPKKEQSDGKLIPNGDISLLRNEAWSLNPWFLGVRTQAHNAILTGFFCLFLVFLLL